MGNDLMLAAFRAAALSAGAKITVKRRGAPTAAHGWTEVLTTIKGRYVATVVMDFKFNENAIGLSPFDELKKRVTGGELDKAIVAILSDEFGDLCSIGLTKQFADLYLTDGGADNG